MSHVSLVFSYGFRPFFSAAVLFAALSLLVWLAAFSGLHVFSGQLDPLTWHAHEMAFGYVSAVLAGFTLTAVSNWTGRPPVAGLPLGLLFALWLCGRVTMALALTDIVPLSVAVVADVVFLPTLALIFGREVIAGGNKRNLVVVAAILTFAIANVLFGLNVLALFDNDLWMRLGLGTLMILIALIGGRITPAFTSNWLAAEGRPVQMPSMGIVDKVALGLTGLGAVLWTGLPDAMLAGLVLVAAGLGLSARLARWHGLKTIPAPLLAALHGGYLLLAASLMLIGMNIVVPKIVPAASGLHLLTAGAIGIMTCVVMTRAVLGHTGRPLVASSAYTMALFLIAAGSILRALAPFAPQIYLPLVSLSGLAWSGGFLFLAIEFIPMSMRPRLAP